MNKSIILVNSLTTFRIMGALLLYPLYVSFGTFFIATFTVLLYFTDLLDGFLARKLKASTFFGSIYDTIADKILNISLYIIVLSITPLLYSLLLLKF